MIKGFEDQINQMFKTNVKYKGEERKLLIKTIKDNPTHCWEVTNTGLIHYPLDVLPKKIKELKNQDPTGEKKRIMKIEIINQIKALITNKEKDTYYTKVAISVDYYGNLCFIGIDTNCDGEIFYLEPIINQPPTEKKDK